MSDTPDGRLPGGSGRVTMREVAALAGVSTATVSHVINDKQGVRIGPDARRRVREAVAELGYRPNLSAAALVKGESRFIGLLADSIATTPFAGAVIRGAQDEAWRLGCSLLITNTEDNAAAEAQALEMMLDHQVQGVLYSTWYHREVVVPAGLSSADHVLVNCFSSTPGVRAVVPDEGGGGRTATRILLDAGHRRIAFLNTTTPSPARTGRLAGYREALADAGVAFDPALVIDTSPEQEGGYAAGLDLPELGVTGVFCHNDRVAMGVYDALRDRGLRVPDDVSVVGFDNQEVIAAHLRPPLSTVALPHYELGVLGVRLLMRLGPAEGPDPSGDVRGAASSAGPVATDRDGIVSVICPAVPRSSVAAPPAYVLAAAQP